MANIDVSDLLSDPDFINDVTIIRRTSTVNTYGQNSLSESSILTVGNIQPANNKEIQRLPESLRMADIRAFYIRTEILQDGTSAYPDILVFNSKRFQVLNSEPWGNYGSGYYRGLCTAEAIAP